MAALTALLADPGWAAPNRPADRADADSPASPAMAAHLAQLRPKVPAGFTVVVQPPFVVVGDEAPAMVRLHAIQTVKWAVDKLKQDYFRRDPAETIDIWLFRDKVSYLCYYLQEKGLLTRFYKEFSAGAAQDPRGYETLKRVLGEKDMGAFQKKWEKFVLGLRMNP